MSRLQITYPFQDKRCTICKEGVLFCVLTGLIVGISFRRNLIKKILSLYRMKKVKLFKESISYSHLTSYNNKKVFSIKKKIYIIF